MAEETSPDGYLFELYHKYIGEPDEERDVYVGFGLFVGGIGLAVMAFLMFLWSERYEAPAPNTADAASSAHYLWLEPAIALGLLSLPIAMLGIVVLLPSERRVQYTSVGGVALTALATAFFLYAYPADWYGHGADYTVEVVGLYAIGLAGIAASTGAALIAHYLELAAHVEYIEHKPDGEDEIEETENYTDEQIRRDIDAAMEGVEYTWGGVERTETSRLEFTGSDFEGVEIDIDAKTVRSSGGVDTQVAGLKGLKGGEAKTTMSNSDVDDQTAKLRELKQQQRAEEVATAEEEDSPVESVSEPVTGVIDRIRRLIAGR